MSKVPGSEQHPATLQQCRLHNTLSKSSVCWDNVPDIKKKKKKIMNQFNFSFFSSPYLFFLNCLVCGCSGGAVSGVGWEELSCGRLQMRQLAGSDVPDGCVTLKYE